MAGQETVPFRYRRHNLDPPPETFVVRHTVIDVSLCLTCEVRVTIPFFLGYDERQGIFGSLLGDLDGNHGAVGDFGERK